MSKSTTGAFFQALAPAFFCLNFLFFSPLSHAFLDQDDDGIADAIDNCTLYPNPLQTDINGDGIGNLCDADLNNDDIVDQQDIDYFKVLQRDKDHSADLNLDGRINTWDQRIVEEAVGSAPGPYASTTGPTATVFARPRLFADDARLAEVNSRLGDEPYTTWFDNVISKADQYAGEDPPCNDDPPTCGASDSIYDYTESKVRSLGRKLPWMAMAWRLTGNIEYVDGMRKWMNALVDYPVWGWDPLKEVPDQLDLGDAQILSGMSVAYDWAYDEFTPTERQLWRSKMATVAQEIDDEYAAEDGIWWADSWLQNHNYTLAMALTHTAIALYGEEPAADTWLMRSDANMQTVLGHLSPDGASHEGVGYWSTGLISLLKHYKALERFKPSVMGQVTSNGFLQNTASYRLYASLPDYIEHVDYADGPRTDYHGPGVLLRALAGIFADERANWLAEKIEQARGTSASYDWLDLLWYDPALGKTPPNDLPTAKYFDNFGILFARSSWEEDAFWSFYKSGPSQGYHAQARELYAGSHIHPDEGSFLAWSQGKWLLIDDGYVTPKHTENHNVLVFNNEGQVGGDDEWFRAKEVEQTGASVSLVHASIAPDTQYVITENADMYRDAADVVSWQRSFVSIEEGYQVIFDEVVMNNPGQVDALLHAPSVARSIDTYSAVLNPADTILEAYDRSGNGYDGTVYGGVITTGKDGNGLALVSTGDKVSVQELDGVAFPATGTLSLWIKGEGYAAQANKRIFDGYDAQRDHLFIRAYAGSTSNPVSGIQVAFQPPDAAYVFAGTYDLSESQWHHVVVTWDTQNDRGQIYIDGGAPVKDAAISDTNWTPSGQLMQLGNGFIGEIDEVSLYSRVLDEAEVASLYALVDVSVGQVGYWSFNGIDSSVNPDFREYAYRLLSPSQAVTVQEYAIPEEEHHSVGNYEGKLISSGAQSVSTLEMVHFIGDRDTPVSYDELNKIVSIQLAGYEVRIDLVSRQVTRQ